MHCKSLWIKASAKCINVKLITKWKISKHLERKREKKKGLLPFFTSFGLHSELKMAKPYSINKRLSSELVSATLFITVSLFYSFWLWSLYLESPVPVCLFVLNKYLSVWYVRQGPSAWLLLSHWRSMSLFLSLSFSHIPQHQAYLY